MSPPYVLLLLTDGGKLLVVQIYYKAVFSLPGVFSYEMAVGQQARLRRQAEVYSS